MSTPPKTARELCALVESLLVHLPPDEQKRFWLLITENTRNWHLKRVLGIFQRVHKSHLAMYLDLFQTHADETDALVTKLKLHRRPTKNADRDAEIMKLHDQKKTAGEIVLALRDRYQLTDRKVTAVISRERRKRLQQQDDE